MPFIFANKWKKSISGRKSKLTVYFFNLTNTLASVACTPWKWFWTLHHHITSYYVKQRTDCIFCFSIFPSRTHLLIWNLSSASYSVFIWKFKCVRKVYSLTRRPPLFSPETAYCRLSVLSIRKLFAANKYTSWCLSFVCSLFSDWQYGCWHCSAFNACFVLFSLAA